MLLRSPSLLPLSPAVASAPGAAAVAADPRSCCCRWLRMWLWLWLSQAAALLVAVSVPQTLPLPAAQNNSTTTSRGGELRQVIREASRRLVWFVLCLFAPLLSFFRPGLPASPAAKTAQPLCNR